MTVKTRFAPSPTGYLHVGSVRTALYSWLYAKKMGGEFVLRIEDTDRERSTQAAVDVILQGMKWLELDHDEGPFYQTERLERYQGLIEQLLAEGKAYRCYCSKERLDTLRAEQMTNKQKPRYDGHCRELSGVQEGDYVVRFKTPKTGQVSFIDKVRGAITINNEELDDLIIARSDGMPTYNFTVVVDDMDMGISHVIRGDDHINNTPRQIHIFEALGGKIPTFAHVPMILGDDGQKLSKRHGALSVLEYRDAGYLKEALLNYLVRLGWSHGDQEVFSIAEMIEYFELEDINRAPSGFNTEKLQWLNQHYMKTLPLDNVVSALKPLIDYPIDNGPALAEVVTLQRERCKDLKEMAEKSRYWFCDDICYDEGAEKKQFKEAALEPLKQILAGLTDLTSWGKEAIHDIVAGVVEANGLKFPKVAQPIRVAVTGNTISPSIDDTLVLLGRERTLSRLSAAVSHIEAKFA